MTENLFALIRARIPGPGKPFIETPDGRVLSYGEMVETSSRFANALRGYGVAPGDRVAVQVDKSPEAVLLYLACLRAGAVYLPLNTGYTACELEYFFGDAEPALVVCASSRHEEIAPIAKAAGAGAVATLDADGSGTFSGGARDLEVDFDDIDRAGDDLAAILYTSGTTGRSKGAMLTHANLASNAETLAALWEFEETDRLLHALPIFHTHGLFVATNVVLLSGASMLFLPGFDLKAVLAALPRATAMMGVPTFYTRLLSSPDLTSDLVGHMRLFISGSAPLSAQTHAAFESRTGHTILERYGMTETNMITSNPYAGARKAGTVGAPLPDVEVRIADPETGAALPIGEVGMIEVKGPNVFAGYWRMPEKTKSEFRDDGFFITGDLGRFGADGYLEIAGRDKDLIITGGFNVYPAEIETAIDALDGVAESAVIGLPHDDFGEGVTAVVVLSGNGGFDENAARAALANTLAKYKVPKRILTIDQLPRNAMGKVQKAQLREQYAATYRRSQPEHGEHPAH